MRPLLSIVVPTKNRYECLKVIVSHFVETMTPEVELVIQDNSDSPEEFQTFIKTTDNPRIIYNYVKEHLSVVENCDLSINNCSGEYITMIGDDDGWHNSIVSVAKEMKKYNIESLSCHKIGYKWPGVKGVVFDRSGKLYVPHYSQDIKNIDLAKERSRILSKGGISLGYLPGVYHGIVKRDALDAIFSKTGSYFPGPSPDMANSIALSLVLNNHLYYDFPLAVAGHCAKSAGGAGAAHKHCLPINEVVHLPKDTIENWDKRLPEFWTAETIYADSIKESLRRMGAESSVNISAFYGCFLCFHYDLRHLLRPYIKQMKISSFIYGFADAFFRRLKSLINNYTQQKGWGRVKVYQNVNDIRDCSTILNRDILSHFSLNSK